MHQWEVERAKIFSLDKCVKCMNILNLGERTMCTVVLRGKSEPHKSKGRE